MNEQIPYIAYESALTRADKTNKRLWILNIILVALLLITNISWIIYESQFSVTESTTIEAEQEGDVNIVGGGDVNYGQTESKDHQDKE